MTDLSQAPPAVRGLYEGFFAGDIDAALAHVTQDVEWVEHFPFPGVFRSRAAIAAVFRRVASEFDRYEMRFERFLADDESAVAIGRYAVHKPRMVETFHSPFAHLYELRDGLVSRYEGLLDTAEARRIFGELRWD